MVSLSKQEIELGSVHLKLIRLLVLEVDCANDCLGAVVELLGCRAQAVIRSEGLVLGEPRADGAFRYYSMETPVEFVLRLGEGITKVEDGYRLEDDLERVGLILSRVSRGEAVQAFGALVDLERLHSVAALAFLDAVLALALRAHGIRYADRGSE